MPEDRPVARTLDGGRRGYLDVPAPPPPAAGQQQQRWQHDRTVYCNNNNNPKNDYYRPGTITIPTTRGGEHREGHLNHRENSNSNKSRRDHEAHYERNSADRSCFERGREGMRGEGTAYHSDWKCLECACWNYPEDGRCYRCGAYASDMYPRSDSAHGRCEVPDRDMIKEEADDVDNRNRTRHDHQHRRRKESDEEDDGKYCNEDKESDEFGRKPAKRVKPAAQEWPPCFDTHGADYVLDPRSGMFYHASTQFFYDPPTKLYYGNRQATYYRYNDDDDDDNSDNKDKKVRRPKFQVVESMAAAGTADAQPPDPILFGGTAKPNKVTTTTANSGISIKLKTKKLPGSKNGKHSSAVITTTTTAATSVPQQQPEDPLQRRHAEDIHKWCERQDELKKEVIHSTTTTTVEPQKQTPSSSLSVSQQKDTDIARTAKGEPICRLCQRKFPTIDKLEYHIRVSQLHAENLKKKKRHEEENEEKEKAKKNKTEEVPSPTTILYVDRAQQRRVLYGHDTATSLSLVAAAASSSVVADVVRPEDTLGTHHVGNQMLQKLGWKTGTSIGRRSHIQDPALQSDWERIEALSSAQQQQHHQKARPTPLHTND